jgi:hypothetical protein
MRIKLRIISRGREDANYELTFTAQTKTEEKAFGKNKKVRKELKKRIEKAYQAYIASKDVYTISFIVIVH